MNIKEIYYNKKSIENNDELDELILALITASVLGGIMSCDVAIELFS